MKHLKIIENLKAVFPQTVNIDAGLLYGSYARNESTGNSDLDIKLIVNNEFNVNDFIVFIKNKFTEKIKSINHIQLRNKVVVYFEDLPKLEFGLCYSLEAIERDFLGSEITNLENVVLFEKDEHKTQLGLFLKHLLILKKGNELSEKDINALIQKFTYEFESCSSKHSRSDGYQFYYFYNIAFHVAIQLNYIAKGKREYYFLPKNLMTDELSSEEQADFPKLNGTTFLPEANKRKRALLDFFYIGIGQLVTKEKFEKLKGFCEWIYQRDFFWNFRDATVFNTKMRSRLIYRTSALALFKNTEELEALLDVNNIKTIIDLRADREIEAISYSEDLLSKVNYVKAQFDPWNQPDWFKEKHNEGSNHEIAYRFFAMGCKASVKKTFKTILEHESGTIAIHCHAGKDRTGIIFSMLHLLLESPIENLYIDYLASEMDVSKEKLNIALDIIEKEGGIKSYLLSCGLSEDQIIKLKYKLLNE